MGVKQQLLSGAFYLTIAKYSNYFASIIVLSIVARILPPEDFGIVAIASVIIGFFNLFSDFGIASAIIQNRNLSQNDIKNIFSLSFYAAGFFVIAYLIILYPINLIYQNSQLLRINLILSIQLVFVSLNIVPNALIIKAKRFRFISIRTLVIHLLCGALAIVCALLGWGIYSLLVIPLLSSLLILVVNYWAYPVEFTFRPAFASFKKILSYSLFNFSFNLVNYFSRNVDKLIIGKVETMANLGYYEKSYSLMLMPVQNIISILNPVLHPVLSDYQDNKDLLYSYFVKLVKILAYIGLPISVFLYFASPDLVHLILGPQWGPASPIFQMFSISVGAQILYTLQGPFFLALNEPKKMFYCGVVTFFFNITAIGMGLFVYKSLLAVALFLSLSYMLSFLFTFWIIVHKVFSRSFPRFILQLTRPVLVVLVVALALASVPWCDVHSGYVLNILWKLLITGGVALFCMILFCKDIVRKKIV